MEAALLEQEELQTIEEVPRERDLNELLALGNVSDDLDALIHSTDFAKLRYSERVEKISRFLGQARWDNQFDIPEFQGDSKKYDAWDKKYAEETADQLRTEEMEAIMPAKKTDVERYTNLIGLATAKAKEFEDKAQLTPAEEKRLEEIKGDIILFSEKLEKARATEGRTPEIVRQELTEGFIKLNKKVVDIAPKNPEAVVNINAAPETPKKNWWPFGAEKQPAAPPEPSRLSAFIAQNPAPRKLGPVSNMNDGVRI